MAEQKIMLQHIRPCYGVGRPPTLMLNIFQSLAQSNTQIFLVAVGT